MKKTTFLNVITFGLFYLYSKNKSKKKYVNSSNKLYTSDKPLISVSDFVNDLGGKDNILDSSATISSLLVILKDIKKIKIDLKSITKKYQAKGFVISGKNKIRFLFGDNSKAICQKMK